MPLQSQSQSRLFHWQQAHPNTAPRGAKKPIPRKVVGEFISATHGKKLPHQHVKDGKGFGSLGA